MEVPIKTAKGELIANLDIDGMPHLEATFELNKKWYKITKVELIDEENGEDGIIKHYQCTARQIGAKQV